MKEFKSYIEAVENYSENYFDKSHSETLTQADVKKYIADIKEAMKREKFKDASFTKSLQTLQKIIKFLTDIAQDAGLTKKDLSSLCSKVFESHIARNKKTIDKLFNSPQDKKKMEENFKKMGWEE